MKYDFDEQIERRGTDCAKWDSLGSVFGTKDVLPFWIADMDFKAPPEVLDILRAKVDHGVMGYPTAPDSLYKAIIDWERTRHGFSVDRSWITWSPGVVAGLSFCMMAFTKPGDEVIIQSPVYHPFFHLIEGTGRKVAANPLKRADGRYTFDLERLEEMITPSRRVLILCSPHNPVMRVWTRGELEALAELAKRKDLLIIADEIHQDLVYSDARHTCFASLSGDAAMRSVTFVAPSKTFNVAGLASSVAIIPNPGLKSAFEKVTDAYDLNQLNLMGQAAMEAAYAKCGGWVDELRDLLVNKAGVALNDGRAFGPEGDGFARLNIGTARARLRDGLERIAEALETL